MQDSLSLTNTRVAFSSRDDHELAQQYRLFGLLRYKWLVKVGAKLTFLALHLHLPVAGLIRRTIFRQFCAGENLQESLEVVRQLRQCNVGSILDYSIEGKGTEEDFESVKLELIQILQIAGLTAYIPYTCLKLTAIMRTDLLERISAGENLMGVDNNAHYLATIRLTSICREAAFNQIPMFIDAEESWIQPAIDQITEEMMWKYNESRAIICTTVQMYRSDRYEYLEKLIATAREKKRFIGVKLVRGAYMEKEGVRAKKLNRTNPINPTKEITDDFYDRALELCIKNHDIVTTCVGTHNEKSTLFAVDLMKKYGIENSSNKVYFSQLYGMSDNITFNLAAHGYNSTKYVPYGPIKSVLPYLVRRAEENTAIAGQMGRELNNIRKEIFRRRKEYEQKKLLLDNKNAP